MTGLLSASELRDLRRDMAGTLTSQATLSRSVETQDDQGRSVRELVNLNKTVRCRITPYTGDQVLVRGERIADEAMHTILLPWGSDVRVEDVLAVAGRDYEVIGLDPRTDALCLSASCWSRG